MAQVTGKTAAEISAEIAEAVVSGRIDPNSGHLMLTTKGGAVLDAGAVSSTTDWAAITSKPSAFTPTTYEHIQSVAAATWTITHNLGRHPQVTIVDSANSEVVGDITHNDLNTVTATFGGAFGGRAYLT